MAGVINSDLSSSLFNNKCGGSIKEIVQVALLYTPNLSSQRPKMELSGPRCYESQVDEKEAWKENNLNLAGCGFTGPIPDSIGSLQQLVFLSLNNNGLSGSIPASFGNLTNLYWLDLASNRLSGPIPVSNGSRPGLDMLVKTQHLLLENNQLTGSIPSTLGLVQTLEVVRLDRNLLTGSVPSNINNLSSVSDLVLRNNQLNGTLDIGSSFSSQLQKVDLQNNLISGFTQRAGNNIGLTLASNPVCEEERTIDEKYCNVTQQPTDSYSTLPRNCEPSTCSTGQISSPNCQCAYPYTGKITFRAPRFSSLRNRSIYNSLQERMMVTFQSHQFPVDSVSLKNPMTDFNNYLVISLEIFPVGQDYFNRTGVIGIGFVFSNQIFKPPENFGPFIFNGDGYQYFSGLRREHKSSSNTGIIIGAAAGGAGLLLLLLLAGFYAYRQKRRAERADHQNNPFALWDPSKNSGGVPQLKGARAFSFEELKKYTNNFSETNNIGSGGNGMVYRGNLPNGQLIAIKRAVQGSTQGALEFKTEIELLSRVHHKNVVSLVGFCFEQGEQMLVYEYIPNGTLKDSLSGNTGIRLDWARRLRIAIGAARGLQYLHDLANPPIIHRDIKSNNILLDERLNAKVADFGLSKPMSDSMKGHVTTQVKGTIGYLDPEYYMTQQLTEKSDVYSFGVVLLELITARPPIHQGKYIVREVRQSMDKEKDLYNLQGVLDPRIGQFTDLRGLEKFVDVSMRCVEEAGAHRPGMSEVVKEIENAMEMAGLNPNVESATTSASYEGVSKGSNSHSSLVKIACKVGRERERLNQNRAAIRLASEHWQGASSGEALPIHPPLRILPFAERG
ncbi:hypothetical protein LguiA_008346 [Lonicera macranthoides]